MREMRIAWILQAMLSHLFTVDQVSSCGQSGEDSKALCTAHAAADHPTFIVDARVLLRNYPVGMV